MKKLSINVGPQFLACFQICPQLLIYMHVLHLRSVLQFFFLPFSSVAFLFLVRLVIVPSATTQ